MRVVEHDDARLPQGRSPDLIVENTVAEVEDAHVTSRTRKRSDIHNVVSEVDVWPERRPHIGARGPHT